MPLAFSHKFELVCRRRRLQQRATLLTAIDQRRAKLAHMRKALHLLPPKLGLLPMLLRLNFVLYPFGSDFSLLLGVKHGSIVSLDGTYDVLLLSGQWWVLELGAILYY